MTDIILKYFIQSTIRHQKIHAKKKCSMAHNNKQTKYLQTFKYSMGT